MAAHSGCVEYRESTGEDRKASGLRGENDEYTAKAKVNLRTHSRV